jgi:hypothetical protein
MELSEKCILIGSNYVEKLQEINLFKNLNCFQVISPCAFVSDHTSYVAVVCEKFVAHTTGQDALKEAPSLGMPFKKVKYGRSIFLLSSDLCSLGILLLRNLFLLLYFESL